MKYFIIVLLCVFTCKIYAQTTLVSGPKKKVHRTPTTKTMQNSPTHKSSKTMRTQETFLVNGVSFKMCYVEGGTFSMGATIEQGTDANEYEKPLHEVTLNGYYIGQTEVTQALWCTVMEHNPSYNKGENLPVENVSWSDCQKFIKKLNTKTGRTFRLPTEAEWEFASRGGRKSLGYKYSGGNSIGDVAWYTSNSNRETHAVATKQANELGIYDMSGNVWEWCSDWYEEYNNLPQNNPHGADTGTYRVDRGGSCRSNTMGCRVSARSSSTPSDCDQSMGLRLVLVP